MAASHVVAGRTGDRVIESRASSMTSWPMGYGWNNPSAIPPPNLGQMSRAGVLVTQHTALQVDVVFTCLRIISNNIVRMGDPWAYTEALSDDNIPYKEYLADQPSLLTSTWGPRQTQSLGMDRTVWSMGLFGEFFWWVAERDNLAYPTALDVLHPAFMEVKSDEQTGLPVYIYGTGQNRVTLDRDNVVHGVFKSLPAARRALNPIEYAGVSIALAMAAYEFGSTWFSQGASPDFVLSTDQKLGQTEVERIAAKFLIEHSGLQSAHLPLVLDSGLKATKVMASPDEAQYLQTLEYARSVISSWFGIPTSWMGNALQKLAEPAPGSMQEEMMRFTAHTLSGFITPIAQALSMMLPQGVKCRLREEELTQPNSTAMAELMQAMRNTQAASVNDVRTRLLGWAPVDGGDDPLAPLASNTAPEQTEGKDTGDTTP